MSQYFKQFIAGSSYIVTLPFFYSVEKSQTIKNYNYFDYTMAAPLWFGLWNVASAIIAEQFGLTMRQRFLLVSILSSLAIMLIATTFNSYQFTAAEWRQYYIYIFIKYLIIWNVVIYNVEYYLC